MLFASAATAVAVAAGLASPTRLRRKTVRPLGRAAVVTLASIGYATPGTVVAIAILPTSPDSIALIDGRPHVGGTRHRPPALEQRDRRCSTPTSCDSSPIAVGGAESALAKLPRIARRCRGDARRPAARASVACPPPPDSARHGGVGRADLRGLHEGAAGDAPLAARSASRRWRLCCMEKPREARMRTGRSRRCLIVSVGLLPV